MSSRSRKRLLNDALLMQLAGVTCTVGDWRRMTKRERAAWATAREVLVQRALGASSGRAPTPVLPGDPEPVALSSAHEAQAFLARVRASNASRAAAER